MTNAGVVWKKEMTDALRDPRTMFFMIAFPLVLYPLLFFGIGQSAQAQRKELESTLLTVAVSNAGSARILVDSLAATPHLKVVESADPAAAVRAKTAQLGIAVPADAPALFAAGRQVRLVVYQDESRELSNQARRVAKPVLQKFSDQALTQALAQRGLPQDLAKPVDVKDEDVAPPEKKGAILLAALLPYFLTIAVATGSITTAIDTTAGEKERSTLETVLVSAASRTDLLVGKLMAVVTTGFIATLSSAGGLGAAFLLGSSIFSHAETSGAAFHIQASSIISVVLLVIPEAVMLAALFMAVGCFAKSAREGQMMAMTLQMAVIFGGVRTLLQQTEPTTRSFMVPVLGTALAQREILRGELSSSHLGVAVISSIVLAAVAIAIATRLFGNERLMFRAK